MSLKGKFADEFGPKIRDRGVAYFRSGLVKIVNHSESVVEAQVKGRQTYYVRLELGKATLNIACTCPYFHEGLECKHVWATMLAADASQYLAAADLRPRLLIYFDDNGAERLLRLAEKEKSPEVPQPLWQRELSQVASVAASGHDRTASAWTNRRQILYIVDPHASRVNKTFRIEIGYRERKMNGDWSKVKVERIPKNVISTLNDPDDREILSIIAGVDAGYYNIYSYDFANIGSLMSIPGPLAQRLVPLMCRTGRCVLRSKERPGDVSAVVWDDGPPWQYWMTVEPDDSNDQYILSPVLRRAEDEMTLDSVLLLADTIVLGKDNRAARFDPTGSRMWLEGLRTDNVRVAKDEGDSLVTRLLELPGSFNLDLPSELQFEREHIEPRPHLIIRKPEYEHWANAELSAELRFHYGKGWLSSAEKRPGIYDATQKKFIERDRAAEEASIAMLKGLGFKLRGYSDGRDALYLQPKKLPRVVPVLIQNGWKVEAEGKLYRNAGTSNLSVSSGIDWFELHGSVSFGDGLEVKLPVLLSALRKGETMIALGDGSFGLMPQEWLEKYGMLTSLGEVEGDHVRFKQTQTGVLDALLAARPEITCDETFARVRKEWQDFKGIQPVKEPAGFIGELRDYQREGLGWFEFLQRFKFGGCLADDMGLGKTVQVLALLESRRNGNRENSRPSLVVVPRSLIFNWEQEAERFTPRLRVLTHTGADRAKRREHLEEYDLILTTYGTLRRDAIHFQDVEFDFVILDEAQAIKNSKTESAKAVRLLKGNHRLALSGTPIENHLGELWSLFDFLNPGMLGTSSVFQASTNGGRPPDGETRQLLSRALRPFLLRRTKQQVATELPEKLEQTIFCEMEESQRRQYNELRDYYRSSLLKEIELVGIKKSKIQILEALLRLRQVACHPDLVQGNKGGTSTKLDVLLPQLADVTEEGHKALVFSQFTSFLSIVRKRLEEQGIDYEYLDGKTRDRQAPVERFQNDPKCKLFLVSLKAGGQGLNLTAAEYVFLLDPWWNPAVEAQAIDRAHRIGQSRRVFAYRLITRDTVEEKVLALQSTKRDLADAIINADNSILKNITGDDLLLLLS